MALTDRFQLFGLKRDEGARTYEAREIATGRPVLVHLFPDQASPLSRALLAKFEALPEHERRRVIERGEHEGGIYLVTDRLADYPGLREWLSGKNEDGPVSLEAGGAWRVTRTTPKPTVDDQLANLFDTVAPPVPEAITGIGPVPGGPPPPVLTNTGEITLLMPRPDVDPSERHAFPIPPSPPPVPVAQPAPPPPPEPTPKNPPSGIKDNSASAKEPGEFTRMFAPMQRPVPPSPPPAAPPPIPAAQDPGEFTSQFSAPPPQKPAGQPGEFTKLFQRPASLLPRVPPPLTVQLPPNAPPVVRAPEAPSQPSPPPSPPPSSPPSSQPGEFTQMLQAQRPAAPMPPPNQLSKSDEFASYFQSPMTPSSQGGSANLPPTPTPPQPPKGAGEFTKIFGRGEIPSAPPPPAPAAPPPPSTGNATQVFAAPRAPAPPPVLSPTTPARNVIPQAPGEYTRMFSAPAPMTLGQPQAPQASHFAESRPVRNKSRLPLLLMIGGALLLIIAVIVYVVMRPHSA
jgi:hypothetical protein